MNWLMYIGGFWIFNNIIQQVSDFKFEAEFKNGIKIKLGLAWIYSLPVWVWVCWRFIS